MAGSIFMGPLQLRFPAVDPIPFTDIWYVAVVNMSCFSRSYLTSLTLNIIRSCQRTGWKDDGTWHEPPAIFTVQHTVMVRYSHPGAAVQLALYSGARNITARGSCSRGLIACKTCDLQLATHCLLKYACLYSLIISNSLSVRSGIGLRCWSLTEWGGYSTNCLYNNQLGRDRTLSLTEWGGYSPNCSYDNRPGRVYTLDYTCKVLNMRTRVEYSRVDVFGCKLRKGVHRHIFWHFRCNDITFEVSTCGNKYSTPHNNTNHLPHCSQTFQCNFN